MSASPSTSGGSDFTTKSQKSADSNPFGGGSGAGVKLEPAAFLIVKGDNVRLLPVTSAPETAAERLIERDDLKCNRLRFRALTEIIDFGGKRTLLMLPQTYTR